MTSWWPAAVGGSLALGLLWFLWAAWRGHRDFTRQEGTFRCRLRVRSAALPGFSPRWSRRRPQARWVHDVLLVRTGWLRPRIRALPVRVAEGELVELDPRWVRGLGPQPVSIRLLLDDQAAVEVATAEAEGALLAGPFVVLAISRLRSDTAPGS
jgi:hypothetical protein